MSEQLVRFIIGGLKAVAAEDPEFRRFLCGAASRLLTDLAAPDREQESPNPVVSVETAAADATVRDSGSSAAQSGAAPPQVAALLRLGDEVRAVTVRGTADEAIAANTAVPDAPERRSDISGGESEQLDGGAAGDTGNGGTGAAELQSVQRRCELKAIACRWVIERRHLRSGTGDARRVVADRDREIFARAKAMPHCYLWMMDPKRRSPPDDEALELVAACYDALAYAAAGAAAMADTPDARDLFEEQLRLSAEAQSALRTALATIDSALHDSDQRETFNWLKRRGAEEGIFLERYMRRDDVAEPRDWPSLRDRIGALQAEWDSRQQRARRRQELLGKVRYHARRLLALSGADAEEVPPADEEWKSLAAGLEELAADGMPASDVQIRQLLIPLLDRMPELDFGPGVRAIVSEIDRYLLSTPHESAEPRHRRQSADVAHVAEILGGKRVALIGGVARPHAKVGLEEAFGLDELVWVSTRSHQSVSDFESLVARTDISLVLLAIRWSSHSFGQIRDMCARYGKPFVRLPAGYSAQQVARQVLQQAGAMIATSTT